MADAWFFWVWVGAGVLLFGLALWCIWLGVGEITTTKQERAAIARVEALCSAIDAENASNPYNGSDVVIPWHRKLTTADVRKAIRG